MSEPSQPSSQPSQPSEHPEPSQHPEHPEHSEAASPVTVYTRPGCGFSSSLLRGLERYEVGFDRVDIWEDEQGAAFVRSVARGNETVPTVRVGGVALVNPSVPDVLAAVAEQAPEHLPEGYEPPKPSRATTFVNRLLGGS